MKNLFFACVICLFSFGMLAQRLPAGVVPEHYQLSFTPNLQDGTFSGEEMVDVRVAKPTTMITLNAAEIKFVSASVDSQGTTEKAKVTVDEDREQATIIAPRMLAPGAVRLHIVFTGILNDKLRGFYLSETPKRRYAVTQFEPTDARRAFPCFDEPDKKATFDITLIVDRSDTAISNERLISDTPGPGESKHTLKFATTKKLSTYLLALLVGDFECVEGSSDGTPIRACSTPDKKDQAKFALEAAEYNLHYYDDYFGIKYPFGKLDLIAIPDFEAGAMENAGAITYRESEMLIDPKIASIDNYRLVAAVVAHEMAHQWFGDLVTMKWWDNLWLNEGFATWMESKPVSKWKPEWHTELEDVKDTNRTLDLDALRNTRPIRQKAETPDEINELFDGIAYGKAAAVLRMVEHYVDPQLFRTGVQNYLRAHSYGNATAEDFWNAIAQASRKPADKIMSSFVAQPGEPLLHVAQETDGQLSVSQERFFSDRQLLGTTDQTWTVPVCWRGASPDAAGSCLLLQSRGEMTKVSTNVPVFGNGDGRGYYHTEYEQSLRERLSKVVESGLNPAERISMLGDEWALVRVGRLSISNYLDLASQLKGERQREVWTQVLTTLEYINDKLVGDQDREQFRQFVRNLLKPQYLHLASTTDPQEKALRADLFEILGILGRDPDVIAGARELAQKTLQEPGSADPLMASRALRVAAVEGDANLFNQLQDKLKGTSDQILRHRYMDALTHFEKPDLLQKALELGTSNTIRNQDSGRYISQFLGHPWTRQQAWKFIQTHWSDVEKTFTTASGSEIVSAAGQFCSSESASNVSAFFRVHPVRASERTLRQAVERINACAEVKKMQEANLQSWLIDHSAHAAAATGR
ncbi:MAG TPA: M1 family metallopeptidase [Terriglobales bacterium]|nr:M1 family metallopeptidase [Terriglobales bacterium]